MKAFITAAAIALLMASAAAPVSAGEPQEKKIRKVVKIEKRIGGAWLGVALREVIEHPQADKKSSASQGVVVSEVVEKSPADSAGIKENDSIVELNGTAVASADDVIKRISGMKTGETVAVAVMRDGSKKTFSVVLGTRPDMETHMEMHMPSMPNMPHMGMPGMNGMRMPPMAPMAQMKQHAGVEGMNLMELTDQLGKYFDAPDGKALLVTTVKKNSNARKAGIEAGDVIVKAGKMDIEDLRDLHEALKDAKEGTTVDVLLLRKGTRKTVKLEVSKHDEMMMNCPGTCVPPGNFNFDHLGIDPGQFRGMMKNLKPEMDKLRKEIRIRIHGGNAGEAEEKEETEESGTEL